MGTNANNGGGIVAFGLRYRRLVILVVTALVAFGIYALHEMDKNEFPGFTVREGLVVAVCPGYNASQMEQEVLKPLEDFIFSYKEVDKGSTHSRVTSGMAIVFVELDSNISDTDAFWNKFQQALPKAKTSMPSGVLALEALTDFGDTSALLIALSSEDKTYRELGQMADNLRDRLRGVKSVGQMSIVGKQKEQITITVDNEKLLHYGIKANTLAVALAAQGFSTTGGELKNDQYTQPIYVSRPVNSVRDIQELIVFSTPEGSVVRVGDIAEVRKEYPEPSSYITNNGNKAVLLSVSMKAGNNIVAMGDEVQKVLDEFQKTLPASVDLFKITDQPTVVSSSVNDFLQELLIAIVAVVIVIMVLLPMRVALIAAATIPITIFISLGIFFALGIELNTVTLACLIVSLGMIVDNSVVIIDNYVELISDGIDHKTAAYRSAVEFLKAIFSATCAISITFFPFLLTLNGMFRDFMNDFPWAITIILFVSLLIAELLVPYLQFRLIKKPIYKMEQEAVASGKKKFSFFTSLQSGYNKLADLCFKWPKTTLALGVITVVWSGWIFLKQPIKLMPIAERNQFAVEIYLPTGTSLPRTDQVADSLANILRQDKRVVSVAIFHGCSSPRFQTTYAPQVGGPNYAQFIVNTVSDDATIDVLNEYTPKFESFFPDAFCRFKQLSYSTADYPIMVRVQGQDYKDIQLASDTLLAMMRNYPGLRLVRPNTSTPQLSAMVDMNEATASRLGLNSLFVEGTLAMRYSSGLPVGTVWEGDYGLPVVIKSSHGENGTYSDLIDEPIPVMEFTSAPVSQFAQVKPAWDFGLLEHYAGKPTITLISETERDLNPLTITEDLKAKIEKMHMPEEISIEYGGDYENTFDILPEILTALSISVVIIFFIILLHYKQVIVSLILLLALTLCIPGAAVGLLIMNEPISLTCTLGLISLMGILVRNAIIMIDYAEELQAKEGLNNMEASLESAKRRMRPIFLTSAAATMGVLPMVISGSALWKPMGTVIFFGTPITMIYTLTVIPVALWLLSFNSRLAPPQPFLDNTAQPTEPQPDAPASTSAPATASTSTSSSATSSAIKAGVVALCLLCGAGAMAQDNQPAPTMLTLEDCRQLAIENNAAVKLAQGNVTMAEETRKEAFTKYFPQVKGQALGFRSNKPVFHYEVMNMFALEFLKHGWGASLMAEQPIFAGGRIANGNKLAKVGVAASKLQKEGAVDEVILTAEQYYWNIVTLKSKKNTLESVIAMLDTINYQVGVAVDAGVVNRNEQLKVQLKLNEMRASMVDLDNGIALSSNLLAQYVGMDGEKIDIVFTPVPEEVPAYPLDMLVDPESALPTTVQYRLLDAQAQAAELEQRITLGENLPTVGVGGGIFYDNLLNERYCFAAGFVSVSIPISGWWGGSHAMKRSKVKAENARLQREDLGQMLKIKMQDTWDNLTAAYRKMEIAHESITQSKENLRISRNFYDAGVSTITDLLDAQTLYRQACDQYIESYGSFRMAQVQYLDATGRTGEQ